MAKLKSGTRVYGGLTVDTTLLVQTDATITGNLTVNGTTTSVNTTNITVKDPIIDLGGGADGAALTTNDGKDRGTLLRYFDAAAETPVAKNAFMGWDNSSGEFAVASNVTIVGEIVTSYTYGNVRAGIFHGDAAGLTNIQGAQVSGTVALASAATTAGTVTTAAQPTITSVGTLTGLDVSGTTDLSTVNSDGIVTISNATAATSTTSGALQVTGGAGIGGNLHVGGTITGSFSGTTSAPGSTTQVVFNDAGTSNATAEFTFNKTTNTVSTVNLVLSGAANVGTDINMTGATASIKGTTLTANGSTALNLEGSTSNIALAATGAIITTAGGNVKLDNSGDLTLSTGALKLPNANISSTGTANLGGALNVVNTANVADVIARNFTENQIAYSDGTSKLVGSGSFTYNAGSSTLAAPTVSATDVNTANVTASSLTETRVTFAGTSGKLVDSANLAFNSTSKTLSVDNATMSGTAQAAEVIVTTLTSTRLPFVDSDKSLTDNANLTFTGGNVLTVTGNVAATNILTDNLRYANGVAWDLQQAAGDTGQIQFNNGDDFTASANLSFNTTGNTLTTDNLQLNADANVANATVRSLTSGRVTLAGTGGKLEDSSGLTFSSSNLAVAGNIAMSGAANISGANVVSATTANITTLNATGSADIGIDLKVSGNANVVGTLKAGDTTIAGNLTVTGTTTSVNTTVTQLTDPVFELGGGANGAPLDTDDGMDRGLVLHRYEGASVVDSFMGWDNSASEFVLAKNVTITDNVVIVPGTTAAEITANLGDLRIANIFAQNANFGGVVFSEGNVTLGAGSKFVGTLEGDVVGNFSGDITVTGGAGAIQFADADDLLTSSANLNFVDSTQTLTVGNGTTTGEVKANLITGTLTTAAQPNVTSVGTLTSLTVTGDVAAGNVKTNNLLYANGVAWDLQQAAGDTGQIQFNNGDDFSASANLTFADNTLTVTGTANVIGTVNAANVTVSSLSNTYVTFAGLNGKLVNSTNFKFDTATNTLDVTGTANVSGTINAANVTVSNLTGGRVTFAEASTDRLVDSTNLTFDATTDTLTTITANVTTLNSGTIVNTGDITAGNVYANSGTVKATYLTGLLTTAAQTNITSLSTLTGLSVNGTANLSAVGNVIITGGTAGQYLKATNSSGGLEYASLDTSIIANDTSNVTIATANGTVNTNVNGSLKLEVTGTGANVTGILEVSGNVNSDNLNTGLITADANVDSTSSITGTVKVTGGLAATGNIYTGKSVGFADNAGGSASKAYIQFNATANSLDFIFD
jgi:hypothetical protein